MTRVTLPTRISIQTAHQIYTVTDTRSDTKWWAELHIGNETVQMQIDTGAAKSLMPYKVYEQLRSNKPICSTDTGFQSYTKHPIDIAGFVVLPKKYKDKSVDVK